MAQNKTQHHLRTLDVNKDIVANIDNGIVLLDRELTIHHYNRWLELHTGIKESQILNQKISDIFENINAKTLIRKIKTALRIGTPTFYSASTSKYLIPIKLNQIKNANFEYMQQDVSIIPLDQARETVALIITDQTIMANTNALLHSHIEEIKELNQELIKERDTIDKKILYVKFDKEANITDISHALINLLHCNKEELLGENFFHLQKLHIEKSMKIEIQTHMDDIQLFDFEENSLTHDGKKVIFKSTLVPEYSAKGAHIGFILFRENITDAKMLALAQEEILASSRSNAMGEMIAMIAHQWRQPLSVINTVVATLTIKKDLDLLNDEIIEKSFKKIVTTTQYLSETIDDFRNYFKPLKTVSEVKINALFEKSLYFMTEEMKQEEIQYNIILEDEVIIQTYKNELLQTLINIVKNSIDAFKESNIEEKKITVHIEKLATHLSIEIVDNAGGIEKDTLKKVFEPYFSTKSKNGTGLGLYMCHTIVTEHLKGNIIITSQNDTTKVHIELPYTIQEKR